MIGFVLSAVMAFAPNGWGLAPSFTASEERRVLPVDQFLAVLPRIWVVYHEDRDATMAAFMPAGVENELLRAESWADKVALRLAVAKARPQRLLPELRVPRLFLYAPYYRVDAHSRPALDMPLDVSQYLASALIEASLDLDPPAGFTQRIADYAAEIPAAERREAYISALAQFGADAFSVAGELLRSLERTRTRGKDPCPVIDRPGTLYHQWGRIFESVEYRGLYRGEGARPGDWSLGPPLSQDDKRYLVEHLFSDFWTGDVRRDFELDCP